MTDELADWLAAYIQKKGYRTYSQSEKNNIKSGNYNGQAFYLKCPHVVILVLGRAIIDGQTSLLNCCCILRIIRVQ
jgi:hypothetical protein